MVKFEGVEPNIEAAKPKSVRTRKPATVTKGDRVRIILEENPDIPPTGQFVGLNGIGYILRPGEPIEVPLGVKEILDNAVMDVPQVDPSTQQIIGTRQRMRYPYRLA